jgi:membrane protease YdiL (CAAX protease family)
MDKKSKKRLIIFLAFAFGIAWSASLVIYLTGGLENSPIYEVSGIQISLALILVSTVYMFSPAIANILTRVITREGKSDLLIKPRFKDGRWIYYLAAWFLPGILTLLGSLLFFLLFPTYFNPNLSTLTDQLSEMEGLSSINPWIIVAIQTLQAMLIAPILNAIPTFGEEFGWRGYLQPKLMTLGARRGILFTGLIWGVWHWPIILMGHNYGKSYFGAPYLGPLAMVWFTLSLSVIFGWMTIKAKNIWPAVIAHGAGNGIAAIGILFTKGNPDPLLGPTPVGIIGGLGLTIVAVLIFLHPNALKSQQGSGRRTEDNEPSHQIECD